METTAYYPSPVGVLRIDATEQHVCAISFVEGDELPTGTPQQSLVIEECIKQLDEYFAGDRTEFDFAFQGKGSDFQQRVWAELMRIPSGKTISYKDLAIRLGDDKLVRAVGLANGKNPIAIVVPCHRVIGSSGKLVGYAGGLWRKQWLLNHEMKRTEGTQGRLFL